MNRFRSIRPVLVGLATLAVVFLLTRGAVKRFRPAGSMTVIEAQAMDMNAMSDATPVGAIPVAAEEVAPHTFAPTVTYTGSVVAFSDAEVYPRITGTLTALTVYPGDRVQAGQVVARLDSAELASKTNEATGTRKAAEHDVIIAQQEHRISVIQIQVAQAKSDAAQMGLREAQEQITVAEAAHEQAVHEQEAAQASLADAEAGVSSAQADADYWRSEIIRETNLYQERAISRQELDREKAQAKTADAKLIQAHAAVNEKRAMIASAQSKVRQMEAGITDAQARREQTQADLKGAQADVIAAKANAEAVAHRIEHQDIMVKQTTAQENTAKIVRDYTEIHAMESGVVTERMVSPGTLVQPGTAILKIKSDARVRLQANVAEADLAGIRVGSAATVTKPRDPTFRLQTQITSIFPAADPQSRTVTVEALTPNPGERLLAGEYIVLEIATANPHQSLTVPLEAVRRDVNQKPYVWTLAVTSGTGGKVIYTCLMHPEVVSEKPGKCPKCGMELVPKNKSSKFTAHRAFVSPGASDGKRMVVESGLQVGQQVLYRGEENLNEGDPVAPVAWGASGPKSLPQASGEMPDMPGMDMGGTDLGKSNAMDGMPGMGGK